MDEGIRIVPVSELLPSWESHKADQTRHNRWAVSWVGGREGYLNFNRGVAGESDHLTAGFMYMPPGVTSPGLHVHGFDELYVVHSGQLAVMGADGEERVIGPLDGAFVPGGQPHTARCVGLEPVVFLYIQGGVEREGFQLGGDDTGSSRWL